MPMTTYATATSVIARPHERPDASTWWLLTDPSAAGPLGPIPVPARATVRRSPGAPASRSALAAVYSPRLRARPAEPGARFRPGGRSRGDPAAGAGPITRSPAPAPRESRHATARLP